MFSPAALLPGLESTPASRGAATREDVILLVEDEDSLAELLACLLRRINVRVLRAADGAQARKLFEENRTGIMLAFVDCHLPDVEGGELCQELRQAAPHLPLLLTSGRDQRALAAMLAAGGPCDFLPKPYMPTDVMQRVRSMLAAAS